MPYLPIIQGYKPFYVQPSGASAARDTAQAWGMILKTSPYPIFATPKQGYSVDWKDEDGVAEYVAAQKLASLEFSVEFVVLSTDLPDLPGTRQIRQQFNRFADALREGYFSIYDSYTGIGWQKVRLAGYTEGTYWQGGKRAGEVFSLQMVCDDPITRMELSSGAIVTASTPALPAVYSPQVADYKPFYVQAMSGNSAIDTKTEWGLVAKVEPCPAIPTPKNPFMENSPQEDGQSGFVKTFFAPREFSVSFFLKAYATQTLSAESIVLSRLLAFRDYITSNRLLALDSWTDVGFFDVQYAGGEVTDFLAGDDFARAIATIRFRCNQPTIGVRYEEGALVREDYAGLNDVNSVHLYSKQPENARLHAIN